MIIGFAADLELATEGLVVRPGGAARRVRGNPIRHPLNWDFMVYASSATAHHGDMKVFPIQLEERGLVLLCLPIG